MNTPVVAGVGWDAATNAQLLVAAATLALAGYTARMASATRTMSKASRDATDQARRASDAAEQAVRAAQDELAEVVRSRIDASGPAVTLMVEPSLEANVLISRGAPPPAGHFLLGSTLRHMSRACSLGDQFVFPRDAEQYLWFVIRCHVHNEGHTSVRVTISSEAKFLPEGPGQDPSNPATVVLRPGQSVSFLWADGHTLGEWADGMRDHAGIPNPNRNLRLRVRGEDLRRSVVDYFFAEVGGLPIEPVPDATGTWRMVQTQVVGTVYPTARWYRHENEPYPKEPWWLETPYDQ